MKALFCAGCSSLQSPPADGQWRHCVCGQSGVRWVDPAAGQLDVWAVDLSRARVIGLHNQMIYAAFGDPTVPHVRSDAEWRQFHHDTCRESEGYLFWRGKRDCWAVIVAPGESGDVRWTTQRPWPGVGDYEPAKHASPNCACGLNGSGDRYVDPICREATVGD